MSDRLRPDQLARYRRHLTLPEVGEAGQARLLASRVLIVGAGGLGCPAAQYLAAAGIGTLGLVDFDRVDLSNLQRQILYGIADVGRPKVEVARARVAALNPDVQVDAYDERLRAANVLDLFSRYDLVLDGSDNFATRYLVNDAAVRLGKTVVHGAVLRFEGQASVFVPGAGPCYRCLHPEPPPPGAVPSCAEGGVLGVVPGLVALVQATEAIKLVAGLGEPLVGRLLTIDALAMRFDEFRLERDPACPACADAAHPPPLAELAVACEDVVAGPRLAEIDPAALAALRRAGTEHLLVDVRDPAEHAALRIPGARLLPLRILADAGEEVAPWLAAWRGRRVVVHCQSGHRSARACALLGQHGFTQVESLRGGLQAWREAELETASGPLLPPDGAGC